MLFGSSLYRYESDRMRYDDAETECNALGEGFGLAKVESQAEQDFVWELAGSPANNPVWISLRRFSEGFRYGDGSALSFEFWATGEPNNLKDSEDCGRLGHKFTSLGADGSWFDTSCTMRSSFVCEGPGKRTIGGERVCVGKGEGEDYETGMETKTTLPLIPFLTPPSWATVPPSPSGRVIYELLVHQHQRHHFRQHQH